MSYYSDHFNLDTFLHSVHMQERADQRISNLKPVRVRSGFNPSGYVGGQRQVQERDAFKAREHYQPRLRDSMVSP